MTARRTSRFGARKAPGRYPPCRHRAGPEFAIEELKLSETFADRLNHLIATVHPPGRGPYLDTEIAAGSGCTSQYIGRLRKGRHAPSLETAAAIAAFFRVRADYFTGPAAARRTDEQDALARALQDPALAKALQDAGVTSVALRATGLSADGLAELHEVIDKIRAEEGLPADQPGSPEQGPAGG